MSYQHFEKLLSHPNPAFVCRNATSSKLPERFLARVEHSLNPGASQRYMEALQALLPQCPSSLVSFYKKHDGGILFDDPLCKFPTGLMLLPVRRMKKESSRFRSSYKNVLNMFFDTAAERKEGDTFSYRSAVAIAVCAASSNYFVVATQGRHAGKVCLFLPEEWPTTLWVGTFDQFLEFISGDPVDLLNEKLGSITRYEDGQTDTQWYPIEYLPNARQTQPSVPPDVPASAASPLQPGRG